MKWKCKSCGSTKKACKGGHELSKKGGKIECGNCQTLFNPPLCCGKGMYVAS